MKHTELPWTVGTGQSEKMIFGGEHRKYVCSVQIYQTPRNMGLYEEEEREANAEYIVKACNAYPDLLETIWDALNYIGNSEVTEYSADDLYERLRQTLKELGEI